MVAVKWVLRVVEDAAQHAVADHVDTLHDRRDIESVGGNRLCDADGAHDLVLKDADLVFVVLCARCEQSSTVDKVAD